MTTKVYARAPEEVPVSYFTPGKLYPVVSVEGGGFDIIVDDGDERLLCFCLWSGCSHLRGGDWERVVIDEPEYIGSRYNRLTVIELEADLAALEVALQAQRAQEALEAIDGELYAEAWHE